MPNAKLTKRMMDAIATTGAQDFYWDTDLPGFGLSVTPAGVRSYVVKYRLPLGGSRRVTIGRYGVLTPDEARDRARGLLSEAKLTGADPIVRAAMDGLTLDALFADWMASHVDRKRSPNTADGYRRNYRKHIAPKFGTKPVAGITRRQVADLHATLDDTPVAANSMLRTLRALLKWGARNQRVAFPAGNPAERHELNKETPVDRILTVVELRALIGALIAPSRRAAVRRALLVQLLTAQRSGEVAGLRRAEVDLDKSIWTIPPERTKNGKKHEVPLGPWARQTLADAIAEAGRSPFVFPSTLAGQSFDAGTLSQACERLRSALKITDVFSPHDLRRTCSSQLEVLGHGEAARGAILNHVSAGVTARHYSAGELSKMKRRALIDWEAALRQIMAGADPFAQSLEDDRAEEARIFGDLPMPASNVVQLKRKVS